MAHSANELWYPIVSPSSGLRTASLPERFVVNPWKCQPVQVAAAPRERRVLLADARASLPLYLPIEGVDSGSRDASSGGVPAGRAMGQQSTGTRHHAPSQTAEEPGQRPTGAALPWSITPTPGICSSTGRKSTGRPWMPSPPSNRSRPAAVHPRGILIHRLPLAAARATGAPPCAALLTRSISSDIVRAAAARISTDGEKSLRILCGSI